MKRVNVRIYIFAVATLSCKQGVSRNVISQDEMRVVSSKTYIPTNPDVPKVIKPSKSKQKILIPTMPGIKKPFDSDIKRDKAYVEFKQIINEYKKQLEIELNKVTANKSVDDLIKSLSEYNTQSQWNYIYTSLEHDESVIENLRVILNKLSNPVEEEPDEENKGFFTRIFTNFFFSKTNSSGPDDTVPKSSVDRNLEYEVLVDDLLSNLFNLTDLIHKILNKWSDEKNLVKFQSAEELAEKSAQLKTIMQARNTAISKIKAQIASAAKNIDDEEKLVKELEKITEDGEANSALKDVESSAAKDWTVTSY
ncbi:hypothetical protein [Borrelia venezuelensis]|uniref:hypothetical protein n=1 Tax=Borrelia venezuelensis TaxID=1653839 RepID=UPI001FF35DC4|nr:hypothetical protein [Borrelia venezuelensis]UPA12608.1 hypothetical protein bvRMA01_000939 [Borrelia venezuelensis]